jgi:hypothetical protein
MVWSAVDDRWNDALSRAQTFFREHGHLLVPDEFVTDDGFRLGGWLAERRKDHKQHRLSSTRVAELDSLGMVWDYREAHWREGIEAARAFQAVHGHLRVRATYVTEDGFRLGQWVGRQRGARAKGQIMEDRIAALDALGMIWDASRLPRRIPS